MKEQGYKNIMSVPRILKITINIGVGEAAIDKKSLTMLLVIWTKIAGQKPSHYFVTQGYRRI